MIWDYTCHDTVAPSYLKKFSIEVGKVAFEAEKEKDKKYAPLTDEFHFEPICVETMGVWGEKGHKFIKNVGRLIKERTKDKRSSSFLFQAISMEVLQRGNCASVLGTVESYYKNYLTYWMLSQIFPLLSFDQLLFQLNVIT